MSTKTKSREEREEDKKFSNLLKKGAEARANNRPKSPPVHLDWRDSHIWMAGWHDQDVAMGNSVIYKKRFSPG